MMFLTANKLLKEFSNRDHIRLVEFTAKNLESNYSHQLRSLDKLVEKIQKNEFIQRQNKTAIGTELNFFLSYENLFLSLHVYDPKGKLLQYAIRDGNPGYKPENSIYETSSYDITDGFVKTLEEKKVLLTDFATTGKNFSYQVYFVPILSKSGEVVAIVGGAISALQTDNAFAIRGISFSEMNFALLYNAKTGIVALDANPSLKNNVDAVLGKTQLLPTTNRLQEHVEVDIGNASYMVYKRYIPELNYWLVLGVDNELLLTKLRAIIKGLLVLLSAATVFSIFASAWIARRLSAPLDKLAFGLKQMHLGNFQHRIEYQKKDEFGYLCNLTDQIGAKLEKESILGRYWTNEEELKKIKQGELL